MEHLRLRRGIESHRPSFPFFTATKVMTDTSSPGTIERLRVSDGFLGNLDLLLSDRLNCFIGGRGTGKTTALEFIRFALGAIPDARIHPQRRRALELLIEGNLGPGRLTIDVRTRAGMHYSAERGAGDATVVKNERGEAVPVALGRDGIFTVDVFSQNEIEEIAANPAAQLELLDRFDEAASARIGREIAELERVLQQSSVELQRLDREIDALAARAGEAAGIEERLKGVSQGVGPDAERLTTAHAAKAIRLREALVGGVLLTAVQRARREVAQTAQTLRDVLRSQLDSTLLDGPNGPTFLALRNGLEYFATIVAAASDTVSTSALVVESSIDEHGVALASLHAAQDAEYAALTAASTEATERSRERERLQAAHVAAQSAERDLAARRSEIVTATRERALLLQHLSELRDERFALRRAVASDLSTAVPTLRVSIQQSADLEIYRETLSEALKGARLKQGMVADRIIAKMLPGELAELAFRNAPDALSEVTGLDPDRARRVIDTMRESGAAYALQLVDIGDIPRIELRDGDTYKETARLSTGQRCTAILPILLRQSDRPLLIDQPEDNLDNAFVFEAVVTALRSVKQRRQIIFVTHNPNIPVLGDAERVFVFESDGQRARVRQFGTVEECKVAIERILEGGPAAFVERMRRYGH
jgi:hypothetical protein